ncbi:MAG: alginate lyase family protein, partial [Kiritimatiellia bacterium]|nr:alginate lyase family protein [Kiritimatiellia bacterium]
MTLTENALRQFVCLWVAGSCLLQNAAAERKPIRLPSQPTRSFLICDEAMRDRLRAVWNGEGPEKDVLAAMVQDAEAALHIAVVYPPRGGQHQQWYQCDPCQTALKTVSDTEHSCPSCGRVYSGEPYDDVLFGRKHNRLLRRAWLAAWVWTFTEDRRFAEDAARILSGYAERYLIYPYHDSRRRTGDKASRTGGRLVEQTLEEASILATRIGPAMDLILDSEALTPAKRDAILNRLIRPLLENIGGNRAGKSNWQSWHNAAMLWGGALLGDVAWIERALYDPDDGFYRQMDISVTPEGMWYETSWGYHIYTLSALVRLAEGAGSLGVDLWSHPTLKKMFFLPAEYAMADGTLPRFGDDGRSLARGNLYDMEVAYHAYRDPALGIHLPESPTFDSIRFGRRTEKVEASRSVQGSRLF